MQAQQEAARLRKQEAEAAKKALVARKEQQRLDEAAAEKQRRAWIMQYVDQEPSNSEDEGVLPGSISVMLHDDCRWSCMCRQKMRIAPCHMGYCDHAV